MQDKVSKVETFEQHRMVWESGALEMLGPHVLCHEWGLAPDRRV